MTTYFMGRSNLVPYVFVWEKGKPMDFSETVVVCDIKVGRCSKLNECMNLYEYQRSRSFSDLGSKVTQKSKVTQVHHFQTSFP